MSDHLHLEDELATIKSITFEEIAEYLIHAGATKACEACGNDGWAVGMKDDKPVITTLPVLHSAEVTLAFILTCKNCGNVRLPSAKFVAKRISEARGK